MGRLGLHAGVADDLRPPRDLRLDPGRALLGRIADRLIAEPAELLHQLGRFQCPVGFGVEFCDRVLRRPGRSSKTIPADDLEAW
jgi:hypothetical protein